MPTSQDSTARALDAVADVADLLRLAHSAVHRARSELNGDALDIADRLSLQLQYLRNVTEVLRHEAGRPAGSSMNGESNWLAIRRPKLAVAENRANS